MAVPTIGRRGAGVVRLTPAVRSYLRNQAQHIAQAEYGPQVAVDRAQLGSVRAQRRTDVRSVRGASTLAEHQLSRAQTTARKSGLHGHYLQDVQSELASRSSDVATSLPSLSATVRGQYAAPIASARNTILGDKAQIASETARNFYSLLSQARTQARATVGRRRSARQAQKPTSTQQRANVKAHRQAKLGVRNAIKEGATLILDPTAKYDPAYVPKAGTEGDAFWATFTNDLAAKEAVSPNQARHAAAVLRRLLSPTVRGQTRYLPLSSVGLALHPGAQSVGYVANQLNPFGG